MFLSIYTFVKNGLYYDFHVADMLKHHLPLADEIVVNEGNSSDGTYEKIAHLDPKIKIHRSDWGSPTSTDWFTGFKNEARRRCRGEWCILLDCDEFIPEWEFDRLREYLKTTDHSLVPLRLTNFYANYKVFHHDPKKVHWPLNKVAIHRNLPDMEVWGDGSNVRLTSEPAGSRVSPEVFECHHFGFVRHPARLREKWRRLPYSEAKNGERKQRVLLPSFLFNWFPHDWRDPKYLADLSSYQGPYIKAVRENPSEFVRDGFKLYNFIEAKT